MGREYLGWNRGDGFLGSDRGPVQKDATSHAVATIQKLANLCLVDDHGHVVKAISASASGKCLVCRSRLAVAKNQRAAEWCLQNDGLYKAAYDEDDDKSKAAYDEDDEDAKSKAAWSDDDEETKHAQKADDEDDDDDDMDASEAANRGIARRKSGKKPVLGETSKADDQDDDDDDMDASEAANRGIARAAYDDQDDDDGGGTSNETGELSGRTKPRQTGSAPGGTFSASKKSRYAKTRGGDEASNVQKAYAGVDGWEFTGGVIDGVPLVTQKRGAPRRPFVAEGRGL